MNTFLAEITFLCEFDTEYEFSGNLVDKAVRAQTFYTQV